MSEKLKEIVNKVNAAFTAHDFTVFLDHSADDLEWTIVGHNTLKGKDAVRQFLGGNGESCESPEFTVETIYAGDDSVTCIGNMTMKDKDGNGSPYSYCDVYGFSGDKIKSLHSFMVKHQTEGEEAGRAAA